VISLYRAGWQLAKVRALMWFALACGIGALWWGVDLAQHYGLNPGDGGVLAPLSARLAWAMAIWLLGAAFAAGMWIYGRCYVARVDYDEQANMLHVYTTGLLFDQRYAVELAGVRVGRYHDGTLDLMPFASPLTVNAPWQAIRLTGRRLPLILDLQGDALEPKLLEKLFYGKTARRSK
jgi:hypothetical protein